MNIKMTLDGDEKLIRRFVRTANVVDVEMFEAMDKSLDTLHTRFTTYTRRRPSSTYDRTGKLGRGWANRAQRRGHVYQGVSWNRVPYAIFVQGTGEQQARVHVGRWPTITKMIEEQRKKIIGFFEHAVRQIRRKMEQ